jgi:phosphoglycolate phosphatase
MEHTGRSAMPQLVVFDLDGTLIDSRLDLAESANEMLAGYGAAPLSVDTVTNLIGEGAKVLVMRALTAAGLDSGEPDALARFLAIYDRRLINHTRPYQGVAEMLRAAAGHAALGVLTNKPERPTRRLLDAFDLSPLFSWVIGGDSSFARKPDPEGLRHLMTAAAATPGSTLMVGDSMIDVQTARAAGARACVALYGFGHLREKIQLQGDEWAVKDVKTLLVYFSDPAGHFS